METVQTIRSRMQATSRAARHFLAEKGDQRWTPADHARYEGLSATVERDEEAIDRRVDSLLIEADHARAQRTRAMHREQNYQRADFYLRHSARERSIQGAMSTTVPAEGGYTVETSVARMLVDRLAGYGWMRQVADAITTAKGGDMNAAASDGATEVGELLAQNAPSTSSDPAFSSRNLTTYKFGSKAFTVPWELVQDSAIDLVGFVFQRARDRIGRSQNAYFTTGSGSAQPTGLVTAASVGKTGTTGQTTTVIYDDLVDLADSVDDAYLGMPDRESGDGYTGAGWMLSQTTRKVVRKLKDANGRPIWTPGDGASPALLLDHPVYINNDMPAPAANAKSITFGNLRRYAVRDVLDVTVFRFDDSAYVLKGQVGYLAWARAGGNLMDVNAVKVYQHSAT